jgi:transcriptional regulator with XRE-family HTH domain
MDSNHELARTQGGLGVGRNMHPSRTKLGQALRQERLNRNWDQTYVARSIGVQQGKISRYERGETKFPPPDRLMALARLFDKPDDYFLEMVGLANWAKVVAQVPPAGAIVIEQPRAGLAELLGFINDMTDAEFVELLQDADLILKARDRDEDDQADALPTTS